MVDVESVTRRAKNSAPGPDGLPYIAWRMGGQKAAHSLLGLLRIASVGRCVEGMNDQLMVFQPKDTPEADEDDLNISREPADTRPLSLKNSDIKICTSAVNGKVKWLVKDRAHGAQRGFIGSRQPIQNVLDVDSKMRMHGSVPPVKDEGVEKLPVAGLFDFRAAFPSVSHKWFMASLESIGCPPGFLLFVKAIYLENRAWFGNGDQQKLLFTIISGILQGCPGSGTFFVVAIEPFINKFSIQLTHQTAQRVPPRAGAPDEVKACADDIAFALFELRALIVIRTTFDEAKRLAALQLQPRKCVLIPSRGPISEQKIKEVREWLAANVAGWEGFQICGTAKLLGFFIGPRAGTVRWRSVCAKYSERTRQIAAVGAPPSVTARLYAARALPTLSYLWQLLPVPLELRRREIYRIHAMLHLPQNSFSLGALFSMHSSGGPRLPSILATALAASVRTATSTLPSWHCILAEMRRWALDEADIRRGARGMVSPVEWDTLSIAEHLEAACDPRKLQLLKMHKQASALNAAFTEHGGLEGIALLEKM